MVHANDIGNACLALAAGISAYGVATSQPEIAIIAIPLGLALKAIGSFVSDHYQERPATTKANA